MLVNEGGHTQSDYISRRFGDVRFSADGKQLIVAAYFNKGASWGMRFSVPALEEGPRFRLPQHGLFTFLPRADPDHVLGVGSEQLIRFVFEGEQLAIDGHDDVSYQSLCAQCYYRYKKEAERSRTDTRGD